MRRMTLGGVALLLLLCAPAFGFQLSPMGTAAERKFAKKWDISLRLQISLAETGTGNFADPTHEGLTQRIYGCDGDWNDCADPDLEYAGPYIIAGVRWNDDPVFQLQASEAQNLPCITKETVSFVTQTRCWYGLFSAAEKKSKLQPTYFLNPSNGNYMLRSHFGDLQFLHSMGTQDGEAAAATKANVLMWAEFVWGVTSGKYRLDTNLKDIEIVGWRDHFSNGHTVQDLFTLGRPWLRPHVTDVAFGSLLHTIEDSFAAGHVDRREPVSGKTCMAGALPAYGAIREFHSYALQDHAKHKAEDSNLSAQHHVQLNEPDVLTAGKKLREMRSAGAPWTDVERFLSECVFELDRDIRNASAGDDFR